VKRILIFTLVFCILAGRIFVPSGSAYAQAGESTTFTFSLCPDDSGAEDVGEEQITMVVTDLGDGEFELAFSNIGDLDTSITDIYLHDPFGLVVDDEVEIDTFGEVNFDEVESMTLDELTCPGVREGGPPRALGFEAVDDSEGSEVSVASIQTKYNNGVNPEEWLKLKFQAKPGITYQQILIALIVGQLKVGIKLLLALLIYIAYLIANTHEHGTYIQLASFEADPAEGGVAVRWETAAEVDNAGFNIYRSSSMGGPFTKINGQLIAAQGSGGGASYELFDPDGTSASFYQLEDLDYNGTSTKHLPMPVKAAQLTFDHQLFVPMASVTAR
jgi:hypothetical protein